MEETKQQPLAIRVAAELAGSFLLCFAIYAYSTWGSAVFGINVVFAALATGLAYAAVTAIFSKVSGGQLNPAVTVAAVLASKTKVLDGVLYVIAQVVGAIAAGFAVVTLIPTNETVTMSIWLPGAVNGFEEGSVSYSVLSQYGISFSVTLAIVVEVIAALLVVAAAMSSLGEHGESSDRHVVAMGLSYALAAAITYPVTGSGLNPARATGIALAAQGQGLTQNPLPQLWVFWICPVLAAAVVALAMIVTQMINDALSRPKAVVAVEGDDAETLSGEMDAVEVEDGTVEAEAVAEETSVEAEASHDEADAEVRDEQSDAQRDADEGVERH